MMVNKKMLLSLMLMIFGGPIVAAEAYDIRNHLGQTELIDYVIKQEAAIADIKSDINRLWDVCYHVVQVYVGQVLVKQADGTYISHAKYRSEIRRRPSCMDSDILALKNREADLSNYIAKVVAEIIVLAKSGEQMNARDNDSKMVLDYCRTQAIHDVLCEYGAQESMMVWAYFNPLTVIALAGLSLCGAAAGIVVAANAA